MTSRWFVKFMGAHLSTEEEAEAAQALADECETAGVRQMCVVDRYPRCTDFGGYCWCSAVRGGGWLLVRTPTLSRGD
jgi:hypothetical protein